MRCHIDAVRIDFFDLIDVGLDVFHLIEIFDCSLFAGGDDQALLAHA